LSSLPLWEALYQGLMDGFLDVSIALCHKEHTLKPLAKFSFIPTSNGRSPGS